MKWAGKQTYNQSGFTIVELLIVVVAIAIIAAITMASYNAMQGRARQSAGAQALSQVGKKISLWKVDNADQLPATLDTVVELPPADSWEYRRFDNNTQYCISTNSQGVYYYMNSTQPSTYIEGRCSDIISIPGISAPNAQADRTTRSMALPASIVGTPDITLYAVFDVIDTTSGWESIAQLRPSTAGSNVFQLDMSGAGSDYARYRIDTVSSPNTNVGKPGVRTPGRHVGWMQVSTNATVRMFNYDAAVSYSTAAFAPGAGWNFTSFGINNDTTGTQPVFGVVFTAAHDQQTRARVLQWLSDTYSVGATF